jgi:hypothetical protein
MERLWFLGVSCTVFVACSGRPAGPDAFCGVGNAATTVDMLAGSTTLTYGNLISIVGNDCSDTTTSVISLTVEGTQQNGTGLLTLCIVRPDNLAGGLQLGTDVKVVDTTGAAGSCTYTKDNSNPASGTARSIGECGNGSSSKGFALVLDGEVSLTRNCNGAVDMVPATLSGMVAVIPQ